MIELACLEVVVVVADGAAQFAVPTAVRDAAERVDVDDGRCEPSSGLMY